MLFQAPKMAKTVKKRGAVDPGFRPQKFLQVKKIFFFENSYILIFQVKGGGFFFPIILHIGPDCNDFEGT